MLRATEIVLAATDVQVAALALLSACIGGALKFAVDFYKAPANRDRVVVDAAQGAVIVQASVMDRMEQELERLGAEMTKCQDAVAELPGLRAKLKETEEKLKVVETERDDARALAERLTARVDELERRLGYHKDDSAPT